MHFPLLIFVLLSKTKKTPKLNKDSQSCVQVVLFSALLDCYTQTVDMPTEAECLQSLILVLQPTALEKELKKQ